MIQIAIQKPKAKPQYSGAELRALNDERLSLGAVQMWQKICQFPEEFEFGLADIQRKYPNVRPEIVAQSYYELVSNGYVQE